MGRTDAPVSHGTVLDEIEGILLGSMEKLKSACETHIPFCRSDGRERHIKYIPERCFVTYFSWGLINADFAVFNEQMVKCEWPLPYPQRFDLLARRFSPEENRVQIKAEAKGNLDGGYKEILKDIQRMECCTLAMPDFEMRKPKKNVAVKRFQHRFNIVLTQNWGLVELSEWWGSDKVAAPRRKGSKLARKGEEWVELKDKLLAAQRRGVMSMMESAPGYNYSIDVLYAIFVDPLKKLEEAAPENAG